MGLQEAKDEFAKGMTAEAEPSTEQVTESTKTAIPSTQAKIEEMEYLLGGKSYKLPSNTEFRLKHNGQYLQTPLDKMANAFRQSQHFEDKGKELRTAREQFEKDRGDLNTYQEMRKKYEAIQAWSEANPQDWEKLWGLFQNKERNLLSPNTANPAENTQLLDKIAFLEKKLSGHEEFMSKFQQDHEENLISQEEKKVLGEIEEFKKGWPELDLQEKNLDGIPLVSLIINHGINEGIRDFKLAAFSYLGPRLQDLLVSRGRNEAVKSVKKDTQQGIVSRSSTPFPGKGSNEVDPRKMSQQDRVKAAKAEFESAMAQSK